MSMTGTRPCVEALGSTAIASRRIGFVHLYGRGHRSRTSDNIDMRRAVTKPMTKSPQMACHFQILGAWPGAPGASHNFWSREYKMGGPSATHRRRLSFDLRATDSVVSSWAHRRRSAIAGKLSKDGNRQ
jgi:hypothetical protein